MSRPINLQRRLRMLAALPAGFAVATLIALALGYVSDGSAALAIVAAICATAIVMAAPLMVKRVRHEVSAAIDDTVARGSAIVGGEQSAAPPATDFDEFAPINALFDTVAKQNRTLATQGEAIATGAFDSPKLDAELSGPAGTTMGLAVEALRASSRRLDDARSLSRAVLDNVADAVVVIGPDGEIASANSQAKACLDRFGGRLDDTIEGWHELSPGSHQVSRVLPDGALQLTGVSVTKLLAEPGQITVLCWHDISDRQALQTQVMHAARTDMVTGLPNRLGLVAAHDQLFEQGRSASVIHIDLAEFAHINQRHGYGTGDHLLKVLGDRLRATIRNEGIVARVSGDEFVLLLDSQGDVVATIARRLLDRIAEPIELADGSRISMGARAGWSTGVVDEGYELLRQASFALVEAKRTPGGISHYGADVAQRDANRRAWEAHLRRALENEEFVLFAQPVVDIFERRVLGVEIFLRWQHPSGRLISPGEFIDIAAESDLINEIDRWVIARSAQEAAKADPNLVFSLNVSSRFMASSHMAEYVRKVLAQTALPAGRVQFDVTETNVAADANGVIDSIKRLNAMGVKVALDDFGTGYSSLAHLLKLAVSAIKIDRGMVSLVSEPEGRGVVAAILAFARRRNLTVVAEGVETETEVAELAKLGCRYQQGYYHAHPAPLADVLASLDSIPFQPADSTELADAAPAADEPVAGEAASATV